MLQYLLTVAGVMHMTHDRNFFRLENEALNTSRSITPVYTMLMIPVAVCIKVAIEFCLKLEVRRLFVIILI